MDFAGYGIGNMLEFVGSPHNFSRHFLKELLVGQGIQNRLDLLLVIKQYSLDGKSQAFLVMESGTGNRSTNFEKIIHDFPTITIFILSIIV